MYYGGKYKLSHPNYLFSGGWLCTLKYNGIKVEGQGHYVRVAIWRANKAMDKAHKLKKQFETFKSQVCE